MKVANKVKYILTGCLMLLSACAYNPTMSNSSSSSEDLPYVFSHFTVIPIPEESIMSMEKTDIYGKDNEWVGKVVFSSPYDVTGIFDFYMTELPKFGWTEVTSTRGTSPVLVYGRYPRIILIQLQPERFSGSTVTMTMSPAPKRKDRKEKKQEAQAQSQQTSSTTDVSQAGSLGLGDASNVFYQSNSNGVGVPPRV